MTRLTAIPLALALMAMPLAARAEAGSMTSDEYKTWIEYKNAMEDPQVLKMKANRRLPAIAKNFRIPLKKLKGIVKKGEQFGETILAENQTAAEAALKATKVGANVSSVELVDQGGTVVAYVSWKSGGKDALSKEASYVAKAIGSASPITQLIALWSCMGTRKVFTAKIRSSATERIDDKRIEDFSETRYLRLFEDVHNIFAGTPPEDQNGCGAEAPAPSAEKAPAEAAPTKESAAPTTDSAKEG